jgi:MFS family permease
VRSSSASIGAALRQPAFRRVWAADAVSSIGTGATTTVLLVLVTGWFGSRGMSAYLLATSLPSLVLAVLAGAIVDRHDRRAVVCIADLARAALTLGLLMIDRNAFVILLALTALRSAAGSFASSANEAIVPSLTEDRLLASSYAAMFSANNLARVAGMGLGGVLLSMHHESVAFAVDAATFVIAAALRWTIGPRRPAGNPPEAAVPPAQRPSLLKSALDGLRYCLRHRDIRIVLVVVVVAQFASCGVNVLLTPLVVHVLAQPAWWLAVIEAAGMAGLLGATAVIGNVVERVGDRRTLGLGLLAAAAGIALIGVVGNVGWLVVLDPLSGIAVAAIQTAAPTIVARATPDALRGRTEANLSTIASGSYLVSLALVGPCAAIVGLRVTFAICAAPAALVALVILLSKSLRDRATPVGQVP